MELVIQNLEAGHLVELDTYDATVREQLDVLAAGFYRLATLDGVELANVPGVGNPRTALSEASTLVRRVLLQRAADTSGTSLEHEPAELRARIERVSEDMNFLLVRLTEHFRGGPLPEPMAYSPPLFVAPNSAAPRSNGYEFQPFWFAVPDSRPLVGTDGGAVSTIEVEPGSWYLAVGNTVTGLIVQVQDGRRGILQNTDGIERG